MDILTEGALDKALIVPRKTSGGENLVDNV